MDAVLFDLDGTLCDYRRHGREVLSTAWAAVGAEPCFTIEDYYGRYDAFAGTADTVDAQREACFEALAADAGEDRAVGRAVARAFADERDHRDVVLLDGAREAVRSLGSDHRLGLVTNGAPGMQAQKLDAIGLSDAFETVVHGGHDAPAKPAPEPFHRALDALAVAPDRAVHVGNSLETDVAGAAAAGLESVWLRNDAVTDGSAAEPDHVVESMRELGDRPWG